MAATAVDPLPMNGSTTSCPSDVYVRMKYSNNAVGFC